jgi:hypothetical protein
VAGTGVYVGGVFTFVGGQTVWYLAGYADRSIVGVSVAPRGTSFSLMCAPNPALMRADVRFALPAAGPVTLAMFDLAGRRVSTLIDRKILSAGPHSTPLLTRGMKAGLYFARLEFGSQVATQRVEVIR